MPSDWLEPGVLAIGDGVVVEQVVVPLPMLPVFNEFSHRPPFPFLLPNKFALSRSNFIKTS